MLRIHNKLNNNHKSLQIMNNQKITQNKISLIILVNKSKILTTSRNIMNILINLMEIIKINENKKVKNEKEDKAKENIIESKISNRKIIIINNLIRKEGGIKEIIMDKKDKDK